MLEIGLVSDGVLYYFEKVSWVTVEHESSVRITAQDGAILLMEDKAHGQDDK